MYKILLACLFTFVAIAGCANKAQRYEQSYRGNGGEPQTADEDRRWRWDVKTLRDSDASAIWSLGEPFQRHLTLTQLTHWERPEGLAGNSPRYWDNNSYRHEFNIINVRASIARYVAESDGDIHLVLYFNNDSLIAEVPSPDSLGERYSVRNQCATVRKWLLKKLGPPAKYGRGGYDRSPEARDIGNVYVVGVPFFDFKHNQIGAAPNGIEIHPVLGISDAQDN